MLWATVLVGADGPARIGRARVDLLIALALYLPVLIVWVKLRVRSMRRENEESAVTVLGVLGLLIADGVLVYVVQAVAGWGQVAALLAMTAVLLVSTAWERASRSAEAQRRRARASPR